MTSWSIERIEKESGVEGKGYSEAEKQTKFVCAANSASNDTSVD
jgi:hypothetical protein